MTATNSNVTTDMIDGWNQAQELGQATALKMEDYVVKIQSLEKILGKFALKQDLNHVQNDVKKHQQDIDWIKD